MRDRNEDDDEEYIPDHEDDDDEVEISSKHLPVPHPLQQQVEQVDQQAMKQPLNRPGHDPQKQHLNIKQQQKQVSAKFCSLRSLSAYRKLRKEQLQTMAHDDDLESKKRKHRGPTKLVGVYARSMEEWPMVILNSFGQPVGPTDKVEKYLVPTEGRKWAMETMDDKWRAYKCRMKSLHYYAYETDAERLKSCPKTMPENQFRALINYWNSELG
ncbi:Acetylglutamate kinase [Bienertia sinuspersici]